MRTLKTTALFRKDYKRCQKRGLDMDQLKRVIDLLLAGKTLDQRYRDHALSGIYTGFRECHIQPDWLLIYLNSPDELVLTAVRTGTHSDLFNL